MQLGRRLWRWYNGSFEMSIMVPLYTLMTSLLAVEVVRRFAAGEQAAWSAPVAVYLFIWLSWFGCSLGVKNDTHLRFPGFRERLPERAQLALACLDNVLWILLTPIVLFGALQILSLQISLSSNITGTTIPMWWAILIIPIAWLNIVVRATQNLVALAAYRSRQSPITSLK